MDILKKLRTEHGFNQQKLSELLCVSRSTIAMWETGKAEPNREILLKLADIFNVSIDYLLGRTDFSAEENRKLCQNVTRLWETIKNPPNPENIIGILQPLQDVIKNEYQFTYEALEQFASYFGVGVDTLTAEPVTEQKSLDTLSVSETELINFYRILDEPNQEAVLNYVSGLAEIYQLRKHKIDNGLIFTRDEADISEEDINDAINKK